MSIGMWSIVAMEGTAMSVATSTGAWNWLSASAAKRQFPFSFLTKKISFFL